MADTWGESFFNIVADFVDGGNRQGLPSGRTSSDHDSDQDSDYPHSWSDDDDDD